MEYQRIQRVLIRATLGWLSHSVAGAWHRFVYPRGLAEGRHLGLQRLGTLAGWHRVSPFMVGVDALWGDWFAYRAVLVTETRLPSTPTEDRSHPTTIAWPRIQACPVRALDSGSMDTRACREHRLIENSLCAAGCLVRLACNVGSERRYEPSQIRHSAAGSLAAIHRLVARRPSE